MKKIYLIIILAFWFSVAYTQSIQGVIKNSESKEPMAGVAVSIPVLKKGVNSAADGSFQLTGLATGKIALQFSFTGFVVKDTVVELTAAGLNNLVIELAPQEEDLDEVVIVSSSRTNSRIEDLPTKVEVLGMEEVKEENGIKPGNIASLLGDIAGIQIQSTNAATGNAEMRIQGLQGKYTQILRDGMPMFGNYSGSFSILQIPPLDLQQIELVKGAASTLYGGGAIAGMVNLVSKKPKLGHDEHSFTLNYSTLKESNANLFFSGRNEKLGYTLFAGGTLQKEVDVDKDGFSDVPSVKSVFVHPRFFVYGKTSTVTIGYTLNYEDRNGGDMQVLAEKPSASHSFFIRNKSLRNTGDVTWEKKLANEALLTAKASASIFNREISSNVFGMKGDQYTWYSEIAYSKKTDKHNWVAGINFNGDDFTKRLPDSSALPNESSNTLGFFAQDDWKLADQLILQAGLRVDVNSQYHSFFLPRVSLMYKPSHKVTMRIGSGFGYKVPTLFNSEVDERDYHYLHGYAAGIQSERSVGANFDVNYKTKAGDWELTVNEALFYDHVKHPVLFNSIAGSTPPYYYYDNAKAGLQTWGSETYVQAIKDELELYFGYVYTNAKRKYDLVNPHLPLIAPHKFAAIIAYEFSKSFRAGIESSYTGKQYLDNGATTTPYLFAAAMVRLNVGKAAFVLNCENLFDYRQNKNSSIVQAPYTNPSFPEIWAPLDGRVVNLSVYVKW
jgi:outer membrane receptor for ferrienterochelin and colicins